MVVSHPKSMASMPSKQAISTSGSQNQSRAKTSGLQKPAGFSRIAKRIKKGLRSLFSSHTDSGKNLVYLQIGLMVIAALLRIGAANTRFVVYSENSYFDEYLMLEQSRFDEYFQPEAENERTMMKTLTFPWFLNLSHSLHIPFNTLMGLLWIASALCVWAMMRKWTSSRWICLFAYVFVLFCPIGFENNNGVHLYRNLILAPFLFMFFALLVWLVLCCWKRPAKKKLPALWPVLGLTLVYPAVYYIKEDGFWMRPVLYFFLAMAACGLVVGMGRKWLSLPKGLLVLVCLLLPGVYFHFQTQRYLDANEKAFGYRGITIRTEGPIQDYAKLVYQIQSTERTMHQWAPQDAVQPTIDASLTLQAMPDFVDKLREISWGNGQLIGGDFLPWRILQAWRLTDHYEQPGNIRRLIPVFEQINQEVEAAMKSGQIQKQTGRFQLTEAGGSRSLAEVLNIFPDLLLAFQEAITLKDYNPTPPSPVNEEQEFLASFQDELGMDLTAPQTEQAQQQLDQQKAASKRVAQLDFGIYRIVIPILFWGGFVCWGYEIYLLIARYRLKKKTGLSPRSAGFSINEKLAGILPVRPSHSGFPDAPSKTARSIFGGAAADFAKVTAARPAAAAAKSGRRIPEKLVLFLVFVLVGFSAGYEFGILWFLQFLYYLPEYAYQHVYWILYYSSGMLPMLYLALLLMLPFEKRRLRQMRQTLSGKGNYQ